MRNLANASPRHLPVAHTNVNLRVHTPLSELILKLIALHCRKTISAHVLQKAQTGKKIALTKVS
jgi:hypothetical protein